MDGAHPLRRGARIVDSRVFWDQSPWSMASTSRFAIVFQRQWTTKCFTSDVLGSLLSCIAQEGPIRINDTFHHRRPNHRQHRLTGCKFC